MARPLLGTMVIAALVAVTGVTASATSKVEWSWKVSGTLARVSTCSSKGQPTTPDQCLFQLPNPAFATGTVTGVVLVTNTSGHRTCYGVSISTSYLVGLQSVCVKAHAEGQYTTKGRASHYDSTQLGVFVTNGSPDAPIQALRPAHSSRFTIAFTERA